MKRIAINGFGRNGRAALKIIMDTPELEIIAVNDLMNIDNAAYLLKYDSVYGKYDVNDTKSIISRRFECYFTSCKEGILYFTL